MFIWTLGHSFSFAHFEASTSQLRAEKRLNLMTKRGDADSANI